MEQDSWENEYSLGSIPVESDRRHRRGPKTSFIFKTGIRDTRLKAPKGFTQVQFKGRGKSCDIMKTSNGSHGY